MKKGIDGNQIIEEATHMPETTTEKQAEQIGKFFNVKLNSGIVKMQCAEWDCESRVFKSDEGFLTLGWMEYADQASLGRITQINE